MITLATQVKAFVATFLRQPHSTHRYYGELVDSYRERLFIPSHAAIGYYTSALLLTRLNHLFETRKIDRKYRDLKFQLMLIIASEHIPTTALSGKAFESSCDSLANQLENLSMLLDSVKSATGKLDAALRKFGQGTANATRSKEFTLILTPHQK